MGRAAVDKEGTEAMPGAVGECGGDGVGDWMR